MSPIAQAGRVDQGEVVEERLMAILEEIHIAGL